MLHSGVRRLAIAMAVMAALLATMPTAHATPLNVRRLAAGTSHIAVYWRGHPNAKVTVTFSRDGVHFGRQIDVGRDEIGEQRHNGITYSALINPQGAKAVRINTATPNLKVTLLPLVDTVKSLLRKLQGNETNVGATQPAVLSRQAWGADESLRYTNGQESWPPTFNPVQKLIVHHTATVNGDADPASTVRAIYQYHAITQGWGDVGYNFLIDESGRIYMGRQSNTPTGEDGQGRIVTGAHAQHFNAGSVGVALLGTLTNSDATAPARKALAQLLAWEADRHHIDPNGATTYTNPTDGSQKTFPNIAGHRDVNPTTECPGGAFYAQLPALRADVSNRVARTV